MTECFNCAKKLESDWNFCPGCGKPIQAARPSAPALEGLADVRAQVFEVIVKQALMGAPWRAICAGPMLVNQITESQVEEEVRRRQGDDPTAPVKIPPPPPQGDGSIQTSRPLPTPDWQRLKSLLKDLAGKDDMELVERIKAEIAEQMAPLHKEIDERLLEARRREANANIESDMSRELNRTRVDLSQNQPPGPHHINWGNNS
ncbi:MAG: zinc ribbon domain-containing protein [Candidatus Obscuribacter sp.]|nr:zinc ribbon domain-containing protein [Candidatus Obscuribacter sp.]